MTKMLQICAAKLCCILELGNGLYVTFETIAGEIFDRLLAIFNRLC